MKTPVSGPIQQFLDRTRSASNKKSPNVVLTIDEAINLSTSITSELLRENVLLKEIIALQKQLIDANTSEFVLDGGHFDVKG